MFKSIINNYKNLDNLIYKIMKKGLIFCFTLCLISIIILFTYEIFLSSPSVYYIGLNLFKISIIWGIEFIICGFIVDGIKKQII